MKLVLYNYICPSSNYDFKAPQVLPYAYGEFLLRKKNGPMIRYLNALEDKSYDEVDRIIKDNFPGENFDSTEPLQLAFGPAACDVDSDGVAFEMNLLPFCDNCAGFHPSSWQMTDPPEFIDVDIPPVEHTLWNSLTVDQRKERILSVLKNYGVEIDGA